jgi:toxin CptA
LPGLLAIVLALFAGFAAQRGSICAVAAVADVVERGDARRYLAFFECALWAFAVLALAGALGIAPASPPPAFPPGAIAAAGGALFGLGAAVNGACAFGTAARLGRGELAFLATPIGFVIGVAAAASLLAGPTATAAATRVTTPALVGLALALFVALQLVRAARALRGGAGVAGWLRRRVWPASLAMAAIGVANALLMLVFAPWPFSSLLVAIGESAAPDHLALKAALAVTFVIGAALAAWATGAFAAALPRAAHLAEKAGGGFLMGAGAHLIPGGNDSLVLTALPHLFAYAIIAYAAMTAAIAAALMVRRRLRVAIG